MAWLTRENYGFDPWRRADNGKGPNEDFDNDGYSNLAEFSKTLALPSTLNFDNHKNRRLRQRMLSLAARPGKH